MDFELVKSGKEYFEVLASIIQKAEKTIHLQTYIFQDDETGLPIAHILKEASRRNVQVYILIDAFGSNSLSNGFIKDLQAAGIHIRKFSPIRFFKFQIGRRLHQKVVVIDERYALLGGINIANKYAGYENTAWLDYAVLIQQEQLVKDCLSVCTELWEKKYGSTINKTLLDISKNQIVQHDFARRKREISKSYQRAIQMAQKEIIIVASYFLPNERILHLLKKASQRGVCIHIIVSRYSDVMIFKKATEYLYKDLYNHAIRIFEYEPSVVHAKVMMIDQKWCTVGSFNLNAISEYGSIELNVNITDNAFIRQMHQELQEVMQKHCRVISEKDIVQKVNWWAKINYWLVRFLIRFFFWLLKKPKSYRRQHE
jgi:cardiolipin synthase